MSNLGNFYYYKKLYNEFLNPLKQNNYEKHIFILLIIIITSCRKQSSYYDTVTIDGCEYIQSYVGQGTLVHKEN